jgi:predicted PurR-regulated permease PerM
LVQKLDLGLKVEFAIVWAMLTFALNFIPGNGSIIGTILTVPPAVLLKIVKENLPGLKSFSVLMGEHR